MRILYLAHRLPYPPNRGDRIRSYHTIRFLAQHASVDLACFSDEPVDDESLRKLQKLCSRLAVIENTSLMRWVRATWSTMKGRTITEGVFRSNRFRETIRSLCQAEHYDVVIVFCSSMAQYLRIPELRDTPAIVDLVDVDSQKWLDYSNIHRGWRYWLYRTEGRRLRKWETELTKFANYIALVSEPEADLFRSIAPNDRTYGVYNGVDLEYFSTSKDSTPVVSGNSVFVGVLDYQPNIDALNWFCSNIWPFVRNKVPDATFSIVGRSPVSAVKKLSSIPGVEVVGEVPDVRPYVFSAQVVVAPLRIARGIQNKVLEALAMSKPVIATPEATEGLQLTPGHHAIVPQSEEEWVQSMVHLYNHSDARENLGIAGRQYVETNHSWESCLEPYLSFVQQETDSNIRTNSAVRATA